MLFLPLLGLIIVYNLYNIVIPLYKVLFTFIQITSQIIILMSFFNIVSPYIPAFEVEDEILNFIKNHISKFLKFNRE